MEQIPGDRLMLPKHLTRCSLALLVPCPRSPSRYLGFLRGEVAGPDHAEPGLLLQAALGVVGGDPRRDAHAAALGAGAPLGGLHQAVLLHVVQLRLACWVLPEN